MYAAAVVLSAALLFAGLGSLALARLKLEGVRLLAGLSWAWGVNGCASVMGAVPGKCLAMDLGFRAIMVLAWMLYLLAALLFPGDAHAREKAS